MMINHDLNTIIVFPVILVGFILGYLSSAVDTLTLFIVGSYMIIIWSALYAVREERDWFNPLTLVIALSFFRFTVPWVLLAIEEPPASLRYLRLTLEDWQSGHLLVLLGLLAVILGWCMHPRKTSSFVQCCIKHVIGDRTGSTIVGTWAGIIFIIGMIGWTFFVILNAGTDVLAIVQNGNFRGLTIQEGTGVYFYLALSSISGSSLLTGYLLLKHRKFTFLALIPIIMVAVAFFVLGGRVRSIVVTACGLFMYWHVVLNRHFNLRWFFRATVLIMLVVMFSFAGRLYRGGKGWSGLSDVLSPSHIIAYLRHAAWMDFGQLHALAGAVAVGPGVLQGRTLITALGKIAEWLALSGKSGGVFIVQELAGLGKRKWGYHATFIGNCYLDFGLFGIVFLCTVFGAFLKSIYNVVPQMIGNPIGMSLCTIIIIYSLRIFFESVEEVSELLVLLFFSVSGPFLMRILSKREFAR